MKTNYQQINENEKKTQVSPLPVIYFCLCQDSTHIPRRKHTTTTTKTRGGKTHVRGVIDKRTIKIGSNYNLYIE